MAVPSSKYRAEATAKVSMLSHPETYKRGRHYVNDAANLNSASMGIPFGRVTAHSPETMIIPPQRNSYNSPVGLIVPMDYSGTVDVKKTNANVNVTSPLSSGREARKEHKIKGPGVRPPIVEVKVPINLGHANEEMIRDMSPFLQRSPNAASKILLDIDKKFYTYLGLRSDIDRLRNMDDNDRNHMFKLLGVSSSEVKSKIISDSEYRRQYKERLREKYVDIISDLHKQYRSLPYHTEVSQNRTHTTINDSEDIPSHWTFSTPYIPMLDWVTANHMITSKQHGPEFGGHGMWAVTDSEDYKSLVKGCVINFLIKAYELISFSDIELIISVAFS